jgi:thiol-disulfide isomerase/thioredoxin
MRRSLPFALGAAVVALLVVGLLQAGGGGGTEKGPKFDLDAALAQLEGAPAPLAALHEQPSALLPEAEFEDRLKELKGHPVVINKWASWCGPCRAEFPVFQRVSTRLGKEVAFLGLNSFNNRDEAQEFIGRFPVPFPSYVDPDEKLARSIGAPANFPITVFYRADGKREYVHQGPYETDADLIADIDRYAR